MYTGLEKVRCKRCTVPCFDSIVCEASIIPNIRSCKIAKEAWDVLTNLYQAHNEARAAYSCKQLESKHMNKGYSMEEFLTKIKDLNEQLVFADEIIADSLLVQVVLDGLPDSY